MLLLPYEHFSITTRMTPEEVARKLEQIIGPEPAFSFLKTYPVNTKEFAGEISAGKFKIHRNIGYRNSFRPEINGTISKEYNGTNIEIRMTLHVIIIVFLVMFLAFTGLFAFVALPDMVTAIKAHNFDYKEFIPALMFIFICLMTIGGFKVESLRSKKFLKNFFDDENLINNY